VVAPGVPHHVTQRGNRRQQVFFNDEDYALYRDLLTEQCRARVVTSLGYCLMPNHTHLILVPPDEASLAVTLAETHHRYTRHINFRERWRGFLWQGRFASFAMDDGYLMACIRYVELNPLRARLVEQPGDWPWSSARSHLSRIPDALAADDPRFNAVDNWATLLAEGLGPGERDTIRLSTSSGRPLGDPSFVLRSEQVLSRKLGRRKPGPKPQPAPLAQPRLF
jgi:putative transposase